MIPSDAAQETHHLNLHINQENTASLVFTKIGHVSAVDPTTNQIKVVIPDWTNDNATYMESGWIPLGTSVAGNQFGIQLLPFGGATVTDPSGQSNASNGNIPMAEQVLVHVVGRKKGLYIQGVQMFNTVDVPPTGYQDKSGIAAQSGEWLMKHASGSFMYFTNQGSIELNSFTNPAPVLQTTQTPNLVTQLLNFIATAVGTNSNKNGNKPATAEATYNCGANASGGQTNTALVSDAVISADMGTATKTTTIQADATQGRGTYTINITSNNSSMTINIDGNTNTYNLNVVNGTVNVQSETSNIKSNTVNLGTGIMKALLTDVYAQWMEGHTHSGVMSGSDTTGPMVQQVTPDQEAKNANAS